MRGLPPREPLCVAEQSGRDEHSGARIVDAQTQTAKIDGEEQDKCVILSVSETRGTGKACNSSAATKPEHRQSFDRRRQLETVEQHGVETWDREPGNGVGHDHVDRLEPHAGSFGYFDGQLFEQIECMPPE